MPQDVELKLFWVSLLVMSHPMCINLYISVLLFKPALSDYVKWTPSGRRLVTGSQSGEFTLWNGQSFNFEMILQV